MQSSSSFEHARTGRKRPSNLLPGRTNSYELPIASPSFNIKHAINATPTRESYIGTTLIPILSLSKHDNARGESLADISTDISLPPTPVSAGLPLEDAPATRKSVTLPSIDHLLAASPLRQSILTPPTSGRVPMGPRIGCEDDITHFDGPRPQWVQDQARAAFSTVGAVNPPQVALFTLENGCHHLPENLYNAAKSDREQGAVGLGFAANDDAPTPRIGSFGDNALGLYMATTPTQAHICQGVLRAPTLTQQEEGTFPSTAPSSPIIPPLLAWNTDLNFPDVEFSAPPPLLTSIPMEREKHVILEGTMPYKSGLRGLGISLEGGTMEAADEQPQASSSASRIIHMPPTPVLPRMNLPDSTGLTPTMSSARIADVSNRTSPPGATVTSSPSLRAKSKMRSELVRREAEAAVCVRRHRTGSASPPGVDAASRELSPLAQHLRSDDKSVMSPRKRTLGETDLEFAVATTPAQKVKSSATKAKPSTSPLGNPSSPWGVFRLKEEGWKALSPPGGGKALGVSAFRGNSNSVGKNAVPSETVTTDKKQRKTVGGGAAAGPISRCINRGLANKENIAPAFLTSLPTRRDGQALLGSKFRRNPQDETSDVFGNESGRLAAKRPFPSSAHSSGSGTTGRAAHRALISSSRPSSAPGGAPRKRL